MGTRDALPGEPESVGAIWASDHFIEQLQANGTYEPASRTDAALAAALLAWRDEVREDPISAPPRADDVFIDPPPMIQPHRIARRAVAVAGVLLAMSSAMATALDADPLKPVRYLVDLGVTVGERISDPDNDPSADEAPSPSIDDESVGYGGSNLNGVPPSMAQEFGDSRYPDSDNEPSGPGESRATDGEAEELPSTTDPTAEPTDGSSGTDTDPDASASDPSEEPTETDATEEPPSSDPTIDPTPDPTDDPATDPTGTAPPPAEADGEGNGDTSADDGSSGDDANPQDQPAATPDGLNPGLLDGGSANGFAERSGTSDEASGGEVYREYTYSEPKDDSSGLYGDDQGYGDGEVYRESDGGGSAFGDGDSQADDGYGPLGPSPLPNLGLPLDANQWPGLFRHGYATLGQGHGYLSGTMGGPAESHPHRGDAWKSQVLMYLTRLPRSD